MQSRGCDGRRYLTGLYGNGRIHRCTDKSRTMLSAFDASRHFDILDYRTIRILEWRRILIVCSFNGCPNGTSISIIGSLKRRVL